MPRRINFKLILLATLAIGLALPFDSNAQPAAPPPLIIKPRRATLASCFLLNPRPSSGAGFKLYSACYTLSQIAATGFNRPKLSYGVKPKIINWGFVKASSRTVDTIIIHTIHNPRVKNDLALSSIVDILKKHKVAAHYLILRDGSVHQLVAENNIAYHSGWSRLPVPPYTKLLDKSSLGIELANRQNTAPTDKQYESLAKLVKDIKTRHQIKNILGHKDVTSYKTDPWNFGWDKFRAMILEDKK